jgi:hypothetical protein
MRKCLYLNNPWQAMHPKLLDVSIGFHSPCRTIDAILMKSIGNFFVLVSLFNSFVRFALRRVFGAVGGQTLDGVRSAWRRPDFTHSIHLLACSESTSSAVLTAVLAR